MKNLQLLSALVTMVLLTVFTVSAQTVNPGDTYTFAYTIERSGQVRDVAGGASRSNAFACRYKLSLQPETRGDSTLYRGTIDDAALAHLMNRPDSTLIPEAIAAMDALKGKRVALSIGRNARQGGFRYLDSIEKPNSPSGRAVRTVLQWMNRSAGQAFAGAALSLRNPGESTDWTVQDTLATGAVDFLASAKGTLVFEAVVDTLGRRCARLRFNGRDADISASPKSIERFSRMNLWPEFSGEMTVSILMYVDRASGAVVFGRRRLSAETRFALGENADAKAVVTGIQGSDTVRLVID